MKPEKEFKFMVTLLSSDFSKKSLLGKHVKSGCKKDYERYVGIADKDKEFRSWLDDLICNGVLVKDGLKQTDGNTRRRVQCYSIDFKLMFKKLEKNSLYKPTMTAIQKKYVVA